MREALKMVADALREARCEVEEVMHNCAAALAGTARGDSRVEAYRQQLARIDAALVAAEATLAQPEPVAWQHRRPRCNDDGELIGYGDWEEGRGLGSWPNRALYAGSAPTQSAEMAAVTAERDQLRAEVERLQRGMALLTDERIRRLWLSACNDVTERLPFMAFARLLEREHSITAPFAVIDPTQGGRS